MLTLLFHNSIVVGCTNGLIKLFQWSEAKKIWENVSVVEGHTQAVSSITSVEPIVYTIGLDQVVNIMLQTEKEISSIARLGLEAQGTASAYSLHAKIIVCGLADGRLQFFNKEGFIAKAIVKKHQKQIKRIVTYENQMEKTSTIWCCDVGGTISKWKLLSPELATKRKEEKQASLQNQPQMFGNAPNMMMQ